MMIILLKCQARNAPAVNTWHHNPYIPDTTGQSCLPAILITTICAYIKTQKKYDVTSFDNILKKEIRFSLYQD